MTSGVRLPTRGYLGFRAHASCPRLVIADLAQELADVGDEELGFFEGGEVAAAIVDVGPADDGVGGGGAGPDADVVGELDGGGRDAGVGGRGAPSAGLCVAHVGGGAAAGG